MSTRHASVFELAPEALSRRYDPATLGVDSTATVVAVHGRENRIA